MSPRHVEPTVRPAPAKRASSGRPFRADIEGLRAIAIVAVVLYHIPGLTGIRDRLFSGGYLGVDVFFVISGYLITRRLTVEASQGPGIQLAAFYARRVRRILPAATGTLTASVLAALLLQSPLERLALAGDVRSSALFYSNYHFAAGATDYLGEARAPSLVQQFWSLSVEEQFYLLWPALMLAVIALARRRGWPMEGTALALASSVTLTSFAWSVNQSVEAPLSAFFVLPTRAWELAVGALLAVGAARSAALPRGSQLPLAVTGVFAIAVPVAAYGPETTWPGIAAAVPVLGAAAVIAAGERRDPHAVQKILALTPMRILGRYSYSTYLWHWPLFVIMRQQGWVAPAELLAGLVTLTLLSAASFHLLEQPVRRSPWLRARTWPTLGVGLALILTGVAVSTVPGLVTPDLHAGRPAPAEEQRALLEPPRALDYVPSDLTPPLALGTNADDPSAERNTDCEHPGGCSYGDPDAAATIVLFGDSHAGHWTPALAGIVEDRGWRLLRYTRGGCESIVIDEGQDDQCRIWLREVWDEIESAQPALVILSNVSRPIFERSPEKLARGVREALARVPPATEAVILADTPSAAESVPSCLSAHLESAHECEPTWPDPDLDDVNLALATAATDSGAGFVDTRQLLCDGTRCAAVDGRLLVYRDENHLTSAFARSRSEDLGLLLAPWLPN